MYEAHLMSAVWSQFVLFPFHKNWKSLLIYQKFESGSSSSPETEDFDVSYEDMPKAI